MAMTGLGSPARSSGVIRLALRSIRVLGLSSSSTVTVAEAAPPLSPSAIQDETRAS
jgi:hypothetical protein